MTSSSSVHAGWRHTERCDGGELTWRMYVANVEARALRTALMKESRTRLNLLGKTGSR